MFTEYSLNEKSTFGFIEVICGSMFSGKTEKLIRKIKKAKLSNFKTIVFKPKTDSRVNGNYISTHNENKYEAVVVPNENEILDKSKDYQVIGIDEAQFFGASLVEICNKLANDGKRVIVSGLDMDFRGKPFGPMPNLMATAEFVCKLHAICKQTGEMANYTNRKSKDKRKIKIGDDNEYEALSRESFFSKKIDCLSVLFVTKTIYLIDFVSFYVMSF